MQYLRWLLGACPVIVTFFTPILSTLVQHTPLLLLPKHPFLLKDGEKGLQWGGTIAADGIWNSSKPTAALNSLFCFKSTKETLSRSLCEMPTEDALLILMPVAGSSHMKEFGGFWSPLKEASLGFVQGFCERGAGGKETLLCERCAARPLTSFIFKSNQNMPFSKTKQTIKSFAIVCLVSCVSK